MTSEFTRTPKSRAFSFGMSREFFKKVYIKENPPLDASIPGPGAYMIKPEAIEKQAQRYSLRPRTAVGGAFAGAMRDGPGPGAYDLKSTENRNGHCYVAKYKSSGGVIISRTGERFDRQSSRKGNDVPGPGNYDMATLEFDKKGRYSLAKWKNSGAPVFSKARRTVNLDDSVTRKSKIILLTLLIIVTPGPGTYRVGTEFGYYDPNESIANASFSKRL